MKVDFSKKIAITLAVLYAQNSVHVVLADRLGKSSSSSSTVVTVDKIETARLLQKFDVRKLNEDADISTVVQNAIAEFAGEEPDPAHHHSYDLYQKKCLSVLHLLDSHYPGYDILTKYGWLCGADKEDDGEDEGSTLSPTEADVTSAPTDKATTSAPTDKATTSAPTDKATTSSPSKAPSFTPTKAPTSAPTSSPTNCTDTPDWDDGEDDCTWYEEFDEPGCPFNGYGYDGGLGVAADNCCYCKEGSGNDCFPKTCTDDSDCCDSGQEDDWCVLKTGYCWDFNPYGNGTIVSPDVGLGNCTVANECTVNSDCTEGNDPECAFFGPVNNLGLPTEFCPESTRPYRGGVCGRSEADQFIVEDASDPVQQVTRPHPRKDSTHPAWTADLNEAFRNP